MALPLHPIRLTTTNTIITTIQAPTILLLLVHLPSLSMVPTLSPILAPFLCLNMATTLSLSLPLNLLLNPPLNLPLNLHLNLPLNLPLMLTLKMPLILPINLYLNLLLTLTLTLSLTLALTLPLNQATTLHLNPCRILQFIPASTLYLPIVPITDLTIQPSLTATNTEVKIT